MLNPHISDGRCYCHYCGIATTGCFCIHWQMLWPGDRWIITTIGRCYCQVADGLLPFSLLFSELFSTLLTHAWLLLDLTLLLLLSVLFSLSSLLLSKEINLPLCLSLTMLNLASLTLLMNSVHCCCMWGLVTEENNLDLLTAMPSLLSWSNLLMYLTLCWKSCLSAILIIFLAPTLMSFLLELSLTLTGTNPLLIHLKVKTLWLL